MLSSLVKRLRRKRSKEVDRPFVHSHVFKGGS
jgi:hypothetical protein